jgi:hypothetical protein
MTFLLRDAVEPFNYDFILSVGKATIELQKDIINFTPLNNHLYLF